MEIFNEGCYLIATYVFDMSLDQSIPPEQKYINGWIIIGIYTFNIGINIIYQLKFILFAGCKKLYLNYKKHRKL